MSKSKGDIFKHVAVGKVGSNRFDLSHDIKMSMNMGELVPTCAMEVLPGDHFSISVENMLRFAPLIAPVMHKINVTTHYFFVPNRILWPEWEQWITGNVEAEHPYLVAGNFQAGTVADYLGYPQDLSDDEAMKMNAFPMAAYVKIWDEYYRDQNLQTELFVPLVAGSNPTLTAMGTADPFKRAWMHDYFTSALPFAQKGDAVTLPLTNADSVDVTLKTSPTNAMLVKDAATHNLGDPPLTMATPTAELLANNVSSVIDPNGSLEVDINEEAVTINTLRRAFRLQEWLEKNARAGTRYIESIWAHFNQKSSDARMQRPEYIGGAKQNMVISEVLSTAQTDSDSVTTPVGAMKGHGISVGGSRRFNYKSEEHGWIIGLINIQPVTAYQQGLPRSHDKRDRFDYAWPTFANIGEQEIRLSELYNEDRSQEELNSTFGYIPRYSEYKYLNSRNAGEMKTSLAFWNLTRIFANTPVLNEEFIQADPSHRIFAVETEEVDKIYAHIFNNVSCVRKLPKFGVPTI